MKITSFSTDVENVSKLSNRPNIEEGLTADALKAMFDKAGVDIKNYINSVLIEELASLSEGASGARKIGSEPIDAVEGESVQEKLVSLATQLHALANSTIPDGTITPDKFQPEIAEFLKSASIRAQSYTTAGVHSFTVQRTGTYKLTLVGGGAGGGVSSTNHHHKLGGGGGAGLVLWIDLAAGDLCELVIGEGGAGLVSENYALVSQAQNGGDSVFSVNGSVVARAEGGKFSKSERAAAEGGTINCRGGYPKAHDTYGSSNPVIEFSIGGDSLLGTGSAYEGDPVGIGGGGFSGSQSNGEYKSGYDGGSGGAIIEYIS